MPSPRLMIVTEDRSDTHIIRVILSQDLTESMRFFAVEGRYSLATIGRNLLDPMRATLFFW